MAKLAKLAHDIDFHIFRKLSDLNTRQKIALAKVAHFVVRASRKLLGLPMIFTVRRKGLNWRLDLDEGIDFSIYLLGSFEPETLRFYKKLIQPGDVVLDIGANVGAHTLHFAKLVGPRGSVYAFEPTQYAYRKLSTNLGINPNLEAVTKALQVMVVEKAEERLPTDIYSSWPLLGGEGLHKEHLGRLNSTDGACTRSLDDLVSELKIEKVNFIKIDIDGNELTALKGAQETLKRHKPKILIELCPHVCEEHGHQFKDLILLLQNARYKLTDHRGKTLPMDPGSLFKLIPTNGSINAFATSDC